MPQPNTQNMQGMPMEPQSGQMMPQPAPAQPETQPTEPPPGEKRPKWWIWAVVILSIIIVGGLVVYFIFK